MLSDVPLSYSPARYRDDFSPTKDLGRKGDGTKLWGRFKCHLTLAKTQPPLGPLLTPHISRTYLERWRKRRQKRRVKPKNLGLFLKQESGLAWTKKKLCIEGCCVVQGHRSYRGQCHLAGTRNWLPKRPASGLPRRYYPFSSSRQINPCSLLTAFNL